MELGHLGLSEKLRAAVESDPTLGIEATIDFEFDHRNNLISPFVPVEETAGVY